MCLLLDLRGGTPEEAQGEDEVITLDSDKENADNGQRSVNSKEQSNSDVIGAGGGAPGGNLPSNRKSVRRKRLLPNRLELGSKRWWADPSQSLPVSSWIWGARPMMHLQTIMQLA